MVGCERGSKLWISYESGEVPHEFFEWYGWFEFGPGRTGNPGRQGGGEMERSPAWYPLSRPVVLGVEKKEDWEEHRDGILESLQPEGHLEFVLAERAALLSWRLHRVIRYETESIALYQEKIEEDLARQRRFGSGVLGDHHQEEVSWKLKDAQRKIGRASCRER